MKKIAIFIIRYIYAASACLYLFTIGFLFRRNRSLIYTICAHFGFTIYITGKPIIPKIDLFELVSDIDAVQLRKPIEAYGNISIFELIVIIKLIQRYSPAKLFEIGTFDGRTTLNMANSCLQESIVYTLDLPKEESNSTKLPIIPDEKVFIDKEASGLRYLGTDAEKKIIQLYGDSATFDFSPFFNAIDFVFIDGSHSYEYVLNDSMKAIKLLLNNKGIIIWHDYAGWEGVTRALNELYLKHGEFRNLKHIKETSLVCLINC